MNCPACGSPGSGVYRSIDDGSRVTRQRSCGRCLARWATEETFRLRSLVGVAISSHGTASNCHLLPLNATNSTLPLPPAPPSGSVSDPDLFSASGSGARDPSATPTAPKVERRKVYRPPEYPRDFEAFWQEIGTGSKADALKAWGQVGNPNATALVASWRRWEAVAWVDGIGVPHTATWLRRYDWQQEPKPRKAKGGQSAPRSTTTYCAFHSRGGSANKAAAKHDPTCPECRHVAARTLDRVSEPTAIGALGDELPGWGR